MEKLPTALIKEWFLNNRRSFPWRVDPTPYRVWISEVMLQQTQALVVIPYFEKWMARFPTIEALANAQLTEVLKCWEGLGYYSRARNLHLAACQIVQRHNGHLPSSVVELSKIKGIGPYTVGAIRSFAFHEKSAAVDGNVLRLLSRFLAFQEEIDLARAKAHLVDFAENALPDQEPWIVSEAMIELGATICAKKPKCTLCPLKKECLALRHGLTNVLPKKRKRCKITALMRLVAVVRCKNHYLLHKEAAGKIMADLYEFPYVEQEEGELLKVFEKKLNLKLDYIKPLTPQNHSFTRYRAHLFPHLFETNQLTEEHLWKSEQEMHSLPFSSGHRRILKDILA